MAHIEKQRGKYRARFADPLGRVQSRTFARKADAERFLREIEADRVRGLWVDPRNADTPLAVWAEEFLLLCRRLSPTTRETYRRDLDKYVLPRFGPYRLGQLPADEIENSLNDEIASGIAPSSVHRHYRTLCRMLQVAVQKQKILTNPCERVDPPRVPKRDMTFLDWDEVIHLAEAHNERYRALIYGAVDTGMRWSELVGLRRAKVDLRNRKVRVTDNSCSSKTARTYGRSRRQRPAFGRSPSRRSLPRCSPRTWRPTRSRAPMRLCSPTPLVARCRRRAS